MISEETIPEELYEANKEGRVMYPAE